MAGNMLVKTVFKLVFQHVEQILCLGICFWKSASLTCLSSLHAYVCTNLSVTWCGNIFMIGLLQSTI